MLTIRNARTGRVWVLPTMVVVGMLLLSACGGQAAPASTDATTAAGQSSAPATGGTDAPVSFKTDVLPILQSRCIKCHGGEKTENGMNMTDFAHLMAGSENGQVIVASNAATSKLIQLVQSGKMPKRSARLMPAEIQKLVDWINQGALNN